MTAATDGDFTQLQQQPLDHHAVRGRSRYVDLAEPRMRVPSQSLRKLGAPFAVERRARHAPWRGIRTGAPNPAEDVVSSS